MSLVFVFIGILLLFLLISVFKVNAFLSLLVVSFAVGLMNHMGVFQILTSITTGIGNTLGNLVLVIVFGAMLGKLLEYSGAAYQITNSLISLFGVKNIQIAVTVTGFLVGLPMVYNAGFLVLIPLIYTLAKTTKLPLIYLGLPLCASLSVTHGFLPPHPAPTSVAFIFNANVNKTLLLGTIVAIPTIIIAGLVLSKFYKKIKLEPPVGIYQFKEFKNDELPSLTSSFVTALSPIILILLGAITPFFIYSEKAIQVFKFIADPAIALFLSVFIGVYFLGIKRGNKVSDIMDKLSGSVSGIAMILLIIAAGGAFKQVLTDSGTGNYIKQVTSGLNYSPLILTWAIAALLRFAMGSATVACMTAAGLTLPMIQGSGVSPELMVIATGAGSLMFSHFNDIGFWMFKEYFNASVRQTFAVWTVMETLVGILGIIGVLILSIWVHS